MDKILEVKKTILLKVICIFRILMKIIFNNLVMAAYSYSARSISCSAVFHLAI